MYNDVAASLLSKSPTGIAGFDAITGGGVPQGRTTVVAGGPGSGKTVFALQTLAHGADKLNEPGIFVAFEERGERILANAANFDWGLDALREDRLFILNAQPSPELVQSGDVEFGGMLAALDAKVTAMGARRIAIDALDVVLSLLDGPRAIRREIYRLQEWLNDRKLTAIITCKTGDRSAVGSAEPSLDFVHFMVDCAVTLQHEIVDGISQRSLRVVKYRGSSFAENCAPMIVGDSGLEVACARSHGEQLAPVTDERIGSGVARLDTMLGGGYFRGAGILVTGAPGTAKTSLAGAFALEACKRGDRTLFVSFDSRGDEIVRNLASIGLDLATYVDRGLLRMAYSRSIGGSAEGHLLRIRKLARDLGARCVVVDPVSALSKAGNLETSHAVAERLIDWAKADGVTLLCTSLLNDATPEMESTPIQISTIADTWIHLNYQVHAGERNRGLTIVKSRGTRHSNQVRELVLQDTGVTLTDVYTAGGEVLMGTLRFEKERAVRLKREEAEANTGRQLFALESEALVLEHQVQTFQRELERKRIELSTLTRALAAQGLERAQAREESREMRGADAKEREQVNEDDA